MQKDSEATLSCLAVDGGMSDSNLCMQIQADMIGIPVDRPKMRETTAFGAAVAAAFAMGKWQDLEELKSRVGREGRQKFTPRIGKDERDKKLRRWEKAVEMSRGWVENMAE
jgi:glycerol kinase